MNILIQPSQLSGTISIPSSKSMTHRAIICACLAEGISIIKKPLLCEDTLATITCLQQAGVNITIQNDEIIINRTTPLFIKDSFDAKESASTIRFLVPIFMLYTEKLTFYGSERLIKRLNTKDIQYLSGLHFTFFQNYIEVTGHLNYDQSIFKMESTSQWLSGILFTLPITRKKIEIKLPEEYYTDITLQVIKQFGISVKKDDNKIEMNHDYQPRTMQIEVDYSSMAFFLGMSLFSPSLTILHSITESYQPDSRIFSFLEQIGASIISDEKWISCHVKEFADASIDCSKNPDLAPILAAIASVSGKVIRLSGLDKLQYKESNRLHAISEALSYLGANIEMGKTTLLIKGKSKLLGGTRIPNYQDHRIVMSLIAISFCVEQPFIIEGAEAINKSFPNFLDLFTSIGGQYESCL